LRENRRLMDEHRAKVLPHVVPLFTGVQITMSRGAQAEVIQRVLSKIAVTYGRVRSGSITAAVT